MNLLPARQHPHRTLAIMATLTLAAVSLPVAATAATTTAEAPTSDRSPVNLSAKIDMAMGRPGRRPR